MARLKAYISGAISGHPIEEVRAKFREAEDVLSARGDIRFIFNPCEDRRTYNLVRLHELGRIDGETLWVECMKVCVKELVTCDAIFMLPDWKFSRGAKIEHDLAVNLKLEINYL